MTSASTTGLDKIFNLLSHGAQAASALPPNMRFEIEKICRSLADFGPRKLSRKGNGAEFFESRDFRPETDEPRSISARLSARAGRPIVIEREAEVSQHFYLWRDGTPSMDYASRPALPSKRRAAEIMMLGLAKHLARNEDAIGLLDGCGYLTGGRAPSALAQQLSDVTIAAGDRPEGGRRLPRHATVILFSDFFSANLNETLGRLTAQDADGFIVMVLDPQEIDFDFHGHVEFEGLEGEGKARFRKAESLREDYQRKIAAHIAATADIAASHGFKFILQRTDRPLSEGLLALYGIAPTRPPAVKPS